MVVVVVVVALQTRETSIPTKAGSDTAIDSALSSPEERFSNQVRRFIDVMVLLFVLPWGWPLGLLFGVGFIGVFLLEGAACGGR